MSQLVSIASLNLENRFDIFIKHLYARYRDLGIRCDCPKHLYLEHIRLFNLFFEPDGSGKYGRDAFLSSFNEVLDSIRDYGYKSEENPVLIGSDRVPITGAHRLTACLLHDKLVNVEVKEDIGPVYDFNFFRRLGMTTQCGDAAAIEYCRLMKDSFIVLIFPSAKGLQQEVREHLSKAGRIFYEKDISFTKSGQMQLIRQLYQGETWLGGSNDNYLGAQQKAGWCFLDEAPLKVYVLKSHSDALLRTKRKIRDLFGIGNHSIHSTDTHEKCVRLAQQMFNDNSIYFLNNMRGDKFQTYDHLTSEFKRWLRINRFDSEYFCIDGSAVMAAFGLRDARDLDYIHYGDSIRHCDFPAIGNHIEELKYYPVGKDEMIFDPKNYFYYDGIKYTTLNIIRDMKKNRNEPKDYRDVELINSFLAGKFRPRRFLFRTIAKRAVSRDFLLAKVREIRMRVAILRFKLFGKKHILTKRSK